MYYLKNVQINARLFRKGTVGRLLIIIQIQSTILSESACKEDYNVYLIIH